MNKHLHRIIFNASRGMRMVVQETAQSAGKATGATSAVVAAALVSLLAASPASVAYAQIAASPMAPASQRAAVLLAPNGVPLVNIATPSAAGVSHNTYSQFNVGANGVILNNSRTAVQTQLGGYVQGNPFLATGPARIILTEVNGGSATQLRGYLEVAGQRAEIIIANPAGISVDGGGTINASRLTLTTGTPQLNALGGLDSFMVRGGTVTIDGAGLDASTTDYAAILARAVNVNAAIYATDLKVVTGANQISSDHSQVTPTTGTGAAPTFALDVSRLGGMYSGKIILIGTEAGLGVRNAGSIGASAGSLVVTAAGRLENSGTLEGQSVRLASTGDIDNRGGTIRQTSAASLTLTAPTVSNTAGGWIGAEPVPPSTSSGTGTAGGSTGGTASNGGTSSGTSSAGTSSGAAATGTAATTVSPPAPGSITASGAILNDGGKIYAGGPITLQSANLVNSGGTLSVASMALNQPGFSNQGGTLNVSGAFTANLDAFNNSTGTLHAGSLDIHTTGNLLNVDGTLTSDNDANLTVGGKLDNTRGSISGAGALSATVTGAILNSSGTLAANQAVTIHAGSLANTLGSISSATAGTTLSIAGALTSTGRIAAATDLSVQAGSLLNGAVGSLRAGNDVNVAVSGAASNDGSLTAQRNTTLTANSLSGTTGVLGAGIKADGSLATVGDLKVTTVNGLTAGGTNLAAGNASLQGASVDLSGSSTSAFTIGITATQGNVTTSRATVTTPGTLSIVANAQPGQTLVNTAGVLNAGVLDLHVSNIANTSSGQIVQTGTAASMIAVSGTLDNSNSRIASNGQDLSLSAASIVNTGGQIQHAGTGTLGIAAGSLYGAAGSIVTNGAFTGQITGAFVQDGGSLSARQITVNAGSLSNQGGQIVQTGTGATGITVVGAADNSSGGTIASNGSTTIASGSLLNQGGSIRAAGTSDLHVTTTGLLDNSAAGVIGAGGNAVLNVGSLKNDAGSVTAVGNLAATVTGAASNVAGTLASNGNTTITAASLDNTAGKAVAVTGNLAVTTSGTTTNTAGSLQSGGNNTLSNAALVNNSGQVTGHAVSVDTHGGALSNVLGTIGAVTTLDIASGALTNDAGLLQSGGAMSVNTNGQALSNTNAAGYVSAQANGQGGIVSADTLALTTGAISNSAGFIGSKAALTATTGAVSNVNAGMVLGQSTVVINTRGAAYDNTGGQTLAVEDLTLNAGSALNSGGVIRSAGTTTVNAATIDNSATSGTNQGIEGQNVVLTANTVTNDVGAIRGTTNVTITSSGTLSNRSGLISAGDTLAIVDPNAANPAAKTLNVVNSNGMLVADKSLKLDAATFSADGTVTSGKDLSIALTQNLVNNATVSASGNLTYGTTGTLTNNGKLAAGATLTVSGSDVTNAANGEMSGTDTTVVASGTLTNRGLVNSNGATRIDAGAPGGPSGSVNNLGTGRIYGDAVSIGAGTLLNDTETVNGVASSGTIAARTSLDIGATTITNRDGALLFSAGDMFIGGALDGNRYAIGKGGTLNNLSASIESLGDMNIAMGAINNLDTHLTVSRVTTGPTTTKTLETLDGKFWSPSDTAGDYATRYVFHTAPDGAVTVVGKGWSDVYTTSTTSRDVATNADPAQITAGGNMTLTGHVLNRDSKIIAGGTLTASDVDNESTQGQRTTTASTVTIGYNPNRPGKPPEAPLIGAPQTTTTTGPVGGYTYVDHVAPGGSYAVASASTGSATAAAGAAGSVGANNHHTILEVASAVSGVSGAGGSSATSATGASGGTAGASAGTPVVVRTSTPTLTVPTASLFKVLPGANSHFLIETDPAFASYRNWLSSDYLLNNLGLDPNTTLKRLGDGQYEQRLIEQQVAQLTGYRYVDGFSSDETEYMALMNAGVTFARQYGLSVGVALTAAQMAQLTSDIVWLVEQTVTLPDGSTQQVLVPQVYVRVRPGDIDGSGALLSGNTVNLQTKGGVVNSGTIAGRTAVKIDAASIDVLGGRISGGNVALTTTGNLNIIGGTVDARDAMTLKAGGDLNVITTTQSNGGRAPSTNIDRVAGLYVTNPAGTLVASAGRDVNLVGAIVSNQGPDGSKSGLTAISAVRDINFGTVTQSKTSVATSSAASLSTSNSRELGTTITTNGVTILNAGQNVNARQATVDAGTGLLSVHADRDINIQSGSTENSASYSAAWTDKGFLRSSANTVTADTANSTSVGSNFSGGLVSLGANHDINIEGSHVSGAQGVLINAGNNVNIWEGRDTASNSADYQRQTTSARPPA